MAVVSCTKCKQKLRIPDDKRGIAYCPKCSTPNYIGLSAYEHVEKGKGGPIKAGAASSFSKSNQKASSGSHYSSSSPSTPWWLARAVVISGILGFLIISSFNNSTATDHSKTRGNLFTSFIEKSNTSNFTLNRLNPINSESCRVENTREILSKSWLLIIFDERKLKRSYPKLSEQDALSVEAITTPRIEIIFLAAGICLAGILISRTGVGSKYKDLCFIYPTVFLLAIGASWLVLGQLEDKAKSSEGMDFYKSTLLPAERFYSLLTPWLYTTPPMDSINVNYVYRNVIEFLNEDDLNSAIAFAGTRNDQQLEPVARLAYYLHFMESYKKGSIEAAASSIFQAYNTGNINNILQETPGRMINAAFSRALNEYAVQLSKNGDFDEALNIKSKLNHEDAVDGFDNYAWINTYQEELNSKFANSPDSIETFAKIQNTATKYLKSAVTASPTVINYFQCELSEIHLNIAKRQLVSEKANAAITEINFAHNLVKPDKKTALLLSKSLDLKGIQEFENGEIDNSISSFANALAGDVQNDELKCRLALAQMTKAEDLAYIGQFGDLNKLTGEALRLCPNDTLEEMDIGLFVIEAQWNLRRGKLDEAKKLLNVVAKSEHQGPAQSANLLLEDSYKARGRYRKLVEASKWADKIPRITGSICNIAPETGKCDSVILYDGDRVLGQASLDFSYVEIHDFESSMYLKDTLRDGRFDTYELTDKRQTRRLHERDGDYLLDREVVFDARGNLIKNEKYSGRIFMKFPSGAIKNGCDRLSSCDAYLTVRHNGRYLGETRPSVNTQFPVWNTGAALNYKKGDNLTIKMMDYDPGYLNPLVDLANWAFDSDIERDEDDYIDSFIFRKLPETGVWTGNEQNAHLYVEVSPTNAPPGMYEWDNSEYSNLFKHYNSESFNEDILDNIVQGARDTEEYHAFTSKAAAWTLPEIALMPFFGRGKFIQGLIASMVASDVTESALENQDDIKVE